MGTWYRVIVEVTDASGSVSGWLVGSDFESEVVPIPGDDLTLSGTPLAKHLTEAFSSTVFPVLRRNLSVGDAPRRSPSTRVIVGARAEVDPRLMIQRDEWIGFSPAAVDCVNGGCRRDGKREADSALWTCVRSNHDLCLECDRPVRSSARFCAYHQRDEIE